MGVANPTVDPANVVQALVYTLLDVFDASRDLHQTLRAKEKRDHEQNLRSKGYLNGRRIEYVDEVDEGGDNSLVRDKAAVTRQFEIGLQEVGAHFAVGDVITQTTLQSQIITLQSVIITTFLYGPTSPDPISQLLDNLVAASQAAGAAAVDALAAQQQRQIGVRPSTTRSARSSSRQGRDARALPYPAASSSPSTALVHSRREWEDDSPRPYPVKTTILDRPTIQRSDTESTSFTGLTGYDTESPPRTLYCVYALDLQKHRDQKLAASITSDPSPYCPHCKRTLALSPGKSWEVCKDEAGVERCFRIQNRFVVKCHRNSVDGGYSCVLCSQGASVGTICGDVKALIRHVWMDHSIAELKNEDDVIEIIESKPERKRDSGVDAGRPFDSRRSVSLGPSARGRSRRIYDRQVEELEIRVPRREQ